MEHASTAAEEGKIRSAESETNRRENGSGKKL
jgi:hypothetical protein